MAENVKYFDGKKFLWDNEEYPDQGAAQAKAQQYTEQNFEVKVFESAGKHFVYTRRVVATVPQ